MKMRQGQTSMTRGRMIINEEEEEEEEVKDGEEARET